MKKPPDYERIIARLEKQVEERRVKMEKNMNEPSRFYYHRRQWSILSNSLYRWKQSYELFKTTDKNLD